MSSNSSSTDFIISLELTQRYLYRFFGPIFVVFGIISCILSLLVFTRKNLRKSTCAIYFIAFNISSLLFIIVSLLSLTLEIGYNINPASHYLSYCRLRLYAAYLFDILCPLYLLFASVDRALITSHNVRIRQKSTHRLAYIVIGSSALIWSIVQIHAVFFINILEITPDYFYCYVEPGLYFTIVSYMSLAKETTIPALLIVFGYWSWKNIQAKNRIRAVPILVSANRSRDRQFVLMLLIDILVYVLCNVIMPASLMYEQIIQYQGKNSEQIQIVLLLRNVANFSILIPFCVNCYTHFIVSKTFRNEVKNVLLWK